MLTSINNMRPRSAESMPARHKIGEACLLGLPFTLILTIQRHQQALMITLITEINLMELFEVATTVQKCRKANTVQTY